MSEPCPGGLFNDVVCAFSPSFAQAGHPFAYSRRFIACAVERALTAVYASKTIRWMD